MLNDLTRADGDGGPVTPCLKRLLEQGFRAKLRSTPHPLTPPAWVSGPMTGRSPGNHGVYDFMRFFATPARKMFASPDDARDIRVGAASGSIRQPGQDPARWCR